MLRVGLAFTFRILLPQNLADAVDVVGDNRRSNVALEAIDAMIEIGHLRIPVQTGHAFHGKLDSHSRANWTLIPRQTGQ